jgi:hypothetical protein
VALIFNICIYILTVRVVQLKSSSVESTIKQLAAGSNVQDCIPETKIKNFNFLRGRDRMVVGFTTTYAISAYHL